MQVLARDTRASPLQLKKLLCFMKEHSEFAHGWLLEQQGRKKTMEMWELLTASLNALGSGPAKPCWAAWKSNVKKKAQKLRAYARGIADGPPFHPLSDIERRLLEDTGRC
ncbi:hypothetical protein J437_LFUL014666 [Ladona fulva]|uniref:Regulatory protein zeste n=1 Tax=Ladona fulva TaxID=123851 RepID=A0A8K0KF34_LADFU|nr:hypothetical protein J437_LFUL014666 [Ladona fulva]